MKSTIENRKIITIASADSQRIATLSKYIRKHVSGVTIYTAEDGLTAQSKLDNVSPHVFIADPQLPKNDTDTILEKMNKTKKLKATAIILLDHPPEVETHLDDIVTGRIQYYAPEGDETEFVHAINRALNYFFHSEKSEFYLRFISEGEILIRKGEPADFVYFVRRGRLQAFNLTENTIVPLGEIGVGEFVGEMAFINGETRSAHVRALSDCELIEVPIGTFEKVLYKRPSWSKALMQTLTRRIKKANDSKIA